MDAAPSLPRTADEYCKPAAIKPAAFVEREHEQTFETAENEYQPIAANGAVLLAHNATHCNSAHLEQIRQAYLASLGAYKKHARTVPWLGGARVEDAASRLASSVVPSLDLESRCCIVAVMFNSDGLCVPFPGGSSGDLVHSLARCSM